MRAVRRVARERREMIEGWTARYEGLDERRRALFFHMINRRVEVGIEITDEICAEAIDVAAREEFTAPVHTFERRSYWYGDI